MTEQVLMVWDFYDGVRSGIALYRGRPHYFECEFDSAVGDYRDVYRLWPVDEDLLTLATEQWQIFRDWEQRFHSGEASTAAHPGHRGQNTRYDDLEDAIRQRLSSLGEPAHRVAAEFRAKEDQAESPPGGPREMEVAWLAIASGQ